MPRMTRVLHPALNTKAAVITTRLSPATLGDRKTEAGKAHMLHSILLNASMLQNWRLRILACRSSTRNSPNQNESRHRTCSLTSPGAGFFDASHVFFSDEIAKLRWSLRLPNIPRDTCMMKQAQSRTHTPSTMLLCSWPSSCLPNLTYQYPRLTSTFQNDSAKSEAAFAPRCAEVGREERAEAGRAQAWLTPSSRAGCSLRTPASPSCKATQTHPKRQTLTPIDGLTCLSGYDMVKAMTW